MSEGVSFSYAGSGKVLKRLRRHFMAPPRVLWRRWRLPLPLAMALTALVTWLGVHEAPNLHPLNSGWRAWAVWGVLVAWLMLTGYLVSRRRRVKRWSHGPFPPPAGAEKGWYLLESVRGRRIGLLLTVAPTALLEFWIQTAHDGGRTVDGVAAIGAFFVFAGIIRGLSAPGEPAVAVTASGLFNGPEFYRWDEIGDLRMQGEEDLVVATVNGRKRLVELPLTDVLGADVYSLINHYLVRTDARARIADAKWPTTVSHGPVKHP